MTIIPPSQPRSYPLLPIELDPPEHTRLPRPRQRALLEGADRGAAPGARGARDPAARADRRNGGGEIVAGVREPDVARRARAVHEPPGGGRGPLVRLGRADVRERARRQGRPARGRPRRRGLPRRPDRRAEAGAARRLHRHAPRGGGRRPAADRPRGAPVRGADAARRVRDDLGRDGHEPPAPRRAPRAAGAAVRRPDGRSRTRPSTSCSATSRRSRSSAAMRRTTSTSTARRSPPATSSCSPTARRTTTRASSPTPTAASSTAGRTATSRSATGTISAWARTSPGSSSRS